MEKTRVEVYKLGEAWAVRYTNAAGTVAPRTSWPTRDEALAAAQAVAEERFHEHRESVEIHYEDMGHFVLFNRGFGAW